MNKIKKINNNGIELTRYSFISHIEDYLRKLISNPKNADIDNFLKSFGFSSPEVLKLLLYNPTSDVNNAILVRKESIRNGKENDKGEREPDTFIIKYKIPRKNYTEKMNNLYKKIFENSSCNKETLSEDGEGATSSYSSGQYTVPLFGKPIKRKIYLSEEQFNYLEKHKMSDE